MSTFHYAKLPGSGNLDVDLVKLVDTRLLIQGNSGGGKSYALRLLAESTTPKVQTIILDPEGEFATLRERHDMVLVGEGGEVKTDTRSAALLARKLVELKVSAVVDLYELRMQDRRAYVRLFLDSMMSLPRPLWHPLVVIVDEAHLFCPERAAGEAESTASVIALLSQGRKRGFCGVLATQRLSKLHKDAAAECNNVMIGRTTLDVDQRRAADLMGLVGKEERLALRELAPGSFHCFGPAFNAPGVSLAQVLKAVTTHPKAGDRHKMVPPSASKAIRSVLPQLADLPEKAEQEAKDNAALQKRVRELEGELKKKPKPEIDKAELERWKSAAADAAFKALEKFLKDEEPKLKKELTELTTRFIRDVADRFKVERVARVKGFKIVGDVDVAQMRKAFESAPPGRIMVAANDAPINVNVRSNQPGFGKPLTDLSPARQRILNALAMLQSLGIDPANKTQLAFFADQSPRSSGYSNNLGGLRTAGLIDYPAGGMVKITEDGLAQVGEIEAPASNEDLHRSVERMLPPARWRIVKCVIDEYPNSCTRAYVAEKSGQKLTSSGFANNLGALRSLGLIEYPGSGEVMASKILFVE